MNKTVASIIRVTLSFLLLLCLLKMPFGYYQLVRYSALVGFVLLGLLSFQKLNISQTIIYFSLALLFQPFFKLPLGKEIWNLVDVIISIGLITSLLFKENQIIMTNTTKTIPESNPEIAIGKKKRIAREVLIFFSSIAFIVIVWCCLELRTHYYIVGRDKVVTERDTTPVFTSEYQLILWDLPSSLIFSILGDDGETFLTNMKEESNRQELYKKLNQDYVNIAPDGGKSKPYKLEYKTGTLEEFNSKILMDLEADNKSKRFNSEIERLNSHVIYSDEMFSIMWKFALTFFIIIYPLRGVVMLVFWSIKTLKS